MGPPPGSKRSPPMKRSSTAPTSIRSLEHDTLCIIFSYLGLFDVVRSSAVCKFWNGIIKRSKLLQLLYLKQQRSSRSSFSEESLNVYLEELAIEHQRQSLVRGSLHIDQWKGHSLGVDQCRMKRGLVLTGVGDKVMRLWSLERYRCIEEYSIPDGVPLVDFDFDESKIVGLVGTRICIWRRNGQRSIFPSREGQFIKGSCMRYFDPEAVVGCEDGTARVFDMYSKKCSRIVRMHTEPVTCLSLSEDQLIISGSSLGRITVSGLSSDQRVATLRPTDSTGIKSLCFNPASHHVFAGTTAGYASCWDLRTMRQLWKTRVSPNVVYSSQHMRCDTSTLVVGGIDGVLRVLDQNTGEILTSYVMDHGTSSSSGRTHGVIERKIGKEDSS
ncbi:WD40 REPEAT PROTEIN [Salix viminalis]|uniref:WD40 REPEAT PROTEIN n=1 Tax=Salix viminalis TaxID=40686 RepID=A0A9Q0SBK4_SALVM|nr:WD40 REPEAT PROTEIN [Salix viminalis]